MPNEKGNLRILGAIAAVGAVAALSGCTTTRAIWPGDLAVVTAAAEGHSQEPVVVHGPDGHPVVLKGRLDAVVVTRTGEGAGQDRFEAPVFTTIDGPQMTVSSTTNEHRYAPQEIASLEVQHYNRGSAFGGGVAMMVVASLAATGGLAIDVASLALLAPGPDVTERGMIRAALGVGTAMLAVGIGLGIGGYSLIAAGRRDPWRARHKTSTPASAAPTIAAGPGGFKIVF